MERIRAFEVINKTSTTTLVHVQTKSGVVIKSDNIPAGQSIVIDLNNYLSKIKDGDTVFLVPQLGRGTTKKSQEFIYRAGALDKAVFEISRKKFNTNWNSSKPRRLTIIIFIMKKTISMRSMASTMHCFPKNQ